MLTYKLDNDVLGMGSGTRTPTFNVTPFILTRSRLGHLNHKYKRPLSLPYASLASTILLNSESSTLSSTSSGEKSPSKSDSDDLLVPFHLSIEMRGQRHRSSNKVASDEAQLGHE